MGADASFSDEDMGVHVISRHIAFTAYKVVAPPRKFLGIRFTSGGPSTRRDYPDFNDTDLTDAKFREYKKLALEGDLRVGHADKLKDIFVFMKVHHVPRGLDYFCCTLCNAHSFTEEGIKVHMVRGHYKLMRVQPEVSGG